ncbi:MAG: M48 family metallopeptidase [Pontiellaceae bacterium]|nr:M48 family metallopeptidase [Pontiellaceae bacterium]MBN2786308.1 M48 family metallopeptidase [Pontiellaceae bacterium]
MVSILEGLHPHEYEHPFDAKALDSLQGTAGLEILSRKFLKNGIERFYTIQCRGSNLQVTSSNYAEIYKQLVDVCNVINVEAVPDLYIESDGSINAMTVGVDNPLIIVTAGAIDHLSQSEMAFLLGHEIGHVKSRHVLYHLMAGSLAFAGGVVGDYTLGLGNLLTMPLRWALFRWSRMSEFTADRCGLLACQDFDNVVSTFIKMAGLPEKYRDQIDRQSFIKQASEFESLDFEKTSKWLKLASSLNRTHPWTVLRSAELIKWVESGEYQQVLDRQTVDRLRIRYEGSFQFCRRCSYRLQGTERFCNSCGQELRPSNQIL